MEVRGSAVLLLSHTRTYFTVVLLTCDRQSRTRPTLTRHGEGRHVPARASPRAAVCLLPQTRQYLPLSGSIVPDCLSLQAQEECDPKGCERGDASPSP